MGLLALLWLVGCGEAMGTPDAGGPGGSDAGPPAPDAGPGRDAHVSLPDAGAPPPPDAGEPPEPDAGPAPISIGTCADPAPPGTPSPDPLPVYAGTCPALVPGTNTIASSGNDREFILVLPEVLDPTERLPVIFMWHWLGGSASAFVERGEVQDAANELRFIAVVPEEKGDQPTRWPFLVPPASSDARVDEEVRFFDDMLACVGAQFNVNEQCVSSAGVSAGALWTAQLAQRRSRHLSSFLSLSGGVGTGSFLQPVREWDGAEHAMPALVLWGGPTDFCGVDFNGASMALEDGLTSDGHFMVECIHNCSHAQPPLDRTAGMSIFNALWRFALDHPYWLPPGVSPWTSGGLPPGTPDWCDIGPGSATIRTGMCEGGILGSCT
ncbi:MAG: hypothetical protein AB7S26_27200 [Sandaracinaceae bacterium]